MHVNYFNYISLIIVLTFGWVGTYVPAFLILKTIEVNLYAQMVLYKIL